MPVMRISITAAMCALLVPVVLFGQASAGARGVYVPGNTAPPPSCGSTIPNTGPSSASANAACIDGGATFAARAAVDRGRLAVYTSATTSAFSPNGPDQLRWQAFANTSWADRLLVTGGATTPDYLSLSLRLTGNISASAARAGAGCAYGIVEGLFTFSGGNFTDVWNTGGFGASSDTNCFIGAGLSAGSASLPVQFSRTYLVPVLGGQANFIYALSSASYLFSDGTAGGALTLGATGDFENTIVVTDISLRTTGGVDITDQVAFSFLNGTQVTPIAAVPEPSTLVLLGSGLLAVGGIHGRRRRNRAA